ncbi:LCP family protein [Egicoccus sp. AB-alg2]|uniref:LCP family protein n=1 Tax=Egicoccus sp. AB-alg2 TaxID=3242693 RepID=UPI00359D9CC5
MTRKGRRVAVAAGVAIVAVAAVAVGFRATTGSLQRVDDDTLAARERLGLVTPAPDTDEADGAGPEPRSSARSAAPAGTTEDGAATFLVVGNDAGEGRSGRRADVLLLVRLPAPGGRPVLVSLPRDLWVEDLCHGGRQRINAALNGCGEAATGPQLTMLTVEHVTGWRIDHYVEVGFEGFLEVIDAVGGIEICTDHPVRDRHSDLDLPGGCVHASSEQALAWTRSRMTQELVDGRWRTMPGVNDLTRNARQQDVLLQVLGEVAEVRSLGTLRRLASDLGDAVTLGSSLGLDDLLALSGRARDLTDGDVVRGEVPVVSHVTSGGAQVLLPGADLDALFAELAAAGGGEAASAAGG